MLDRPAGCPDAPGTTAHNNTSTFRPEIELQCVFPVPRFVSTGLFAALEPQKADLFMSARAWSETPSAKLP